MGDPQSTVPAGPRGVPVLGNGPQFFRNPLDFPKRCLTQYGDIVGLSLLGSPAVLVGHPEYVKHVLADNFENYQKGKLYREELSFLGNGLLLNEGAFWQQQRKLLAPMFHPDRITQYTNTMVDYASRKVRDLQFDSAIDIDTVMQALTLEIIAKSLMNLDLDEAGPEVRAGLQAVMSQARASRRFPISLPPWIPTPGNRRYRQAISTFDTIVQEVIDEHRTQATPPDDVVTILLEAQDCATIQIDDTQIRDELVTLLLAGHDTTALGISYALYLLAKHPAEQETVQREIDAVLAGDTISVESISELRYLDAVITETLRLFPPSYLFVREAKEADMIGEYPIKEGTTVIIHPWVMHRDDRYYAQPTSFDPSRWLNSLERELHPFAYIPFSGGPRRCIGEHFANIEMKIILATFIQAFQFELAFEPPVSLQPRITLRPASNIPLKLSHR